MIFTKIIIILLILLLIISTTTAATTSLISQYGITWTFDKEYEYGQFVNGDYWVIGPVTIVAIDPVSTNIDGRVMNGSMLDPNSEQGFDSASGHYSAAKNVARPGGNDLSADNPLVIPAGHSLVSAKSAELASAQPILTDASVLTILDSAPDVDSFRPAYAASEKTIKFNLTNINYEVFSDLTPTPSVHSLATVEEWFERVWLDWLYADKYIKTLTI